MITTAVLRHSWVVCQSLYQHKATPLQ